MAESTLKVKEGIAYVVHHPSETTEEKLNPVIFLHAMLCSKEIWTDIPQRVADSTKRTVYTYDARNHGESKPSEGDYKFESNVDDLFSFMDGLSIEAAVLVGHDMGGITAIRAALEKSNRVEKVIIVDMYVQKLPEKLIKESAEFMKMWCDALESVDKSTPKEEVTRTVVPMLFEKLPADKRQEQECEKQAYLKATFVYKEKPNGGYEMLFNKDKLTVALADLEKSQKDYVGSYDGSAYFFYGSESHYKVSGEEETIKKHFPKVEMVKFDKASHFLFVDFPDKFVDELASRLQQSKDL